MVERAKDAALLDEVRGGPPPTPRSLAEMGFAASLVPCRHCGSTRPTRLKLQGGGNSWVLYGPCSACGRARWVNFSTDGDPTLQHRAHPWRELGGAEPSRIITPEQFVAELQRLVPATHADPRTLDVPAWLEAAALNDRAVTTARELLKFPGQDRYREERDRLDARAERFMADAPRTWMLRQHRLTLSEEIRGLLNQVTVARTPTLAEVQAYLERRPATVRTANGDVLAELDASSAVSSIRACAEQGVVTAVLHARSGTRSDIEEALSQKGEPPVIEGHSLGFAVDYEDDGDTVKSVTIRFSEQPRARVAPPPRTLDAATVARALIEPARPPATVGALLDALDVVLDPLTIAASTHGSIVIPRRFKDWQFRRATPHVGVRHAEGAGDLREQRVLAFSLVCPERNVIEVALRKRFETSSLVSGAQGDNYRIFGNWVYTERSCVLGWFEQLPDWLRTPPSVEARAKGLRALLDGIPQASRVAELVHLATSLSPSTSILFTTCDAHGIELLFVPPIPVKVLGRALVLRSEVVRLESESWVLRRLRNRDEPQPAMPLTLGPWTILPRLGDKPTFGAMDDEDLHLFDALDVVHSMRVSRALVEPPPGLVTIMNAILLAPALPGTVREFERAFGFTLTGAHFAGCTQPGSLVIREALSPPAVAVALRWLGETQPRSLDALRGLALGGAWSVELAKGRAYVEARLCASFGKPSDLPNRHEFTAQAGRFILSGHDEDGPCTLAFVHDGGHAARTT